MELRTTFFQPAYGIALRILWELVHRKRSLVFWLVFPLLVLVLNGIIFADRAELTLPEALQLSAPPSLVGVAFFFSGLGGTVATMVSEREQNTLKRLFISPLTGSAYFVGIVMALGWIAVGQTLAVLGLVYGFGSSVQGSPWLAGLVLILSLLIYVGGGFILGSQLARRTEDVNTLVVTFGVPLLILGGAFFPISIFPKSLLAIAVYNPIFHMTEALTQIWSQGQGFNAISNHLWVLLGWSVGMIGGGGFAYHQMLRRERRL